MALRWVCRKLCRVKPVSIAIWIAEGADSGSYGRLLLDGGAAISTSSGLAATLNITTGILKHPELNDTFKGADGVALFAAILLFPCGIVAYGGMTMILTAFKHVFNVEELRRGRQEGRQEILQAIDNRKPDETVEQVVERLRKEKRS